VLAAKRVRLSQGAGKRSAATALRAGHWWVTDPPGVDGHGSSSSSNSSVGVQRERYRLPVTARAGAPTVQEMLAMDDVFVANWSFRQDVKLLLRTMREVLRRRT